MDISVKCLINSISRFIHLVSCQNVISSPIQKDYRTVAGVLKLLKPFLDEVLDSGLDSDEILCKECEELDMAVNMAREFMEDWSPKMSKICSVLRSEPLFMKIQGSLLLICCALRRLLHSSESPNSSLTAIQHCMQEVQSMKQERTAKYIEEAMRSQRNNDSSSTKRLMRIIELIGLTSSQELLKESIAVEKERANVESSKTKGELNQIDIDKIMDLVYHIRDCMVKLQRLEAIPVRPYFCCPLSSELMLDPVIVASGQTYERSSIQKWLDGGLNICPKTRQKLAHTNLIPNYTVKAMIATWCEENNLKLPVSSDRTRNVVVSSQVDHVSPGVSVGTDSLQCSLHGSNSISRSTAEVGNGTENEKQKEDVSPILWGDKPNGFHSREKGHLSPEHSYSHSRSESTSSAVSSIDYVPPALIEMSGLSSKPETVNELSGEITSECVAAFAPNKESKNSLWPSGKQFYVSKTKAATAGSGNLNNLNKESITSVSEELTTASHVMKLIEDLRSLSIEEQTAAAEELRLLAKHNVENRSIIGQCGAIKPLLSLLYSETKLTQEHAVTALLNLSINEDNKTMIAEAGAIEPLIHVLRTGNNGAKENSAAALFSLSVLEEYKAKIGRSGAVKALVDLLGSGTLRGKKDAATALFNLSIFHENKARIVQAGAIKHLVELLDPGSGMVDKAVALLSNLSTVGEGRSATVREGGIPLLVEIVESGSQRGKENAASILLQLCLHSNKFCTLVLQEGAVPPLVALSQSGTPRAKEKAQQLLSHFRNQREGTTGKGKS
ncbi:Beta-catenin [Trema orientale]|uniref:RING-type E3 ubiquitin transferase n=1 Tax=Trema orientale TaxID=63057 RepID=A0A2P5E878_TREOI|nr:Beta-catenin [Trema orientale]